MIHTVQGVFLINFEVFGNVIKQYLECLIYLLNQTKIKEKTKKQVCKLLYFLRFFISGTNFTKLQFFANLTIFRLCNILFEIFSFLCDANSTS